MFCSLQEIDMFMPVAPIAKGSSESVIDSRKGPYLFKLWKENKFR